MRLARLATVLGSILTVLSVAVPGAPAQAARQDDPVTPRIIGGEFVASAPWAAALYYDGYGFYCSGTIIAPRWVVTARHCITAGYPMSVRVGNVRHASGTPARVQRVVNASRADIALLNLDRAVSTSYAPLATADPPVGARNDIYGWGTIEPGEDAPMSARLKRASVQVTSTTAGDAYGGRAIRSRVGSGGPGYGDSGGPQLYRGRLVGVCSTGDYVHQQYASVSANRSWIRDVTGV
jgi:hypothetical protein